MNWYAAAASSTGGTTALRRATARVTAVLIVAALLLRKMDQISAMVPVTNGVAALVPLEVIVPPSEVKTGDRITRRHETAPPDRTAKIGHAQRPALRVACGDRDHPGMASDRRTPNGALVARRGNDERSALRCVIQRFLEAPFSVRRRLGHGNTEI